MTFGGLYQPHHNNQCSTTNQLANDLPDTVQTPDINNTHTHGNKERANQHTRQTQSKNTLGGTMHATIADTILDSSEQHPDQPSLSRRLTLGSAVHTTVANALNDLPVRPLITRRLVGRPSANVLT